jgi:hypothetical protein
MKSALFFWTHKDRVVADAFAETFSAMRAPVDKQGLLVIDHCAAQTR